MNRATRCLSFAILFAVPVSARAEPELAPSPRLVESHVQIERIIGGYQIILTRKASEKLRDALAVIGDGKPYTDLGKLAVKELNDPDAEKKYDLLAFVVKTQCPALKKSLDEKMGPGGAIIKIYGVENKLIPDPPPLAKAIIALAVPAKFKEKMDTGLKVINTTPLVWKVEGRK